MTWFALGLSAVIGAMVFALGVLTGGLVTFHVIVTTLCAAINAPKPGSAPDDAESRAGAIKAAWQGQVRE